MDEKPVIFDYFTINSKCNQQFVILASQKEKIEYFDVISFLKWRETAPFTSIN